MSFFAAVQAELADAKHDRANFSCPDTCDHVGCIEGRAACDGRINALERVLTVGLPSYSLPELKAERHTLDIEARALATAGIGTSDLRERIHAINREIARRRPEWA